MKGNIEFNGELTGVSQEYALKKNARLTEKFLLLSALCSLPFSFIISRTLINGFLVFIIPAIFFASIVIMELTYKKRTQQLPLSICIDGETIKVSFKYNTVTLDINKVKTVYDHGDFYEIVPQNFFLFSVFVCQKDLLTEENLEDFEALFDIKKFAI